ncbi:MAG: hypothetical protein ABIQ54_05380 [Gammaproteobacteria bacterium]
MSNILRIFIAICMLRAKPDDVPSSATLLGTTLAAYLLVNLALASASLPLNKALLYALADTLVLCVLTHTLLLLRRLPARLTQTLTALAGTGALFGLVALPFAQLSELSPILFSLLIWSVAVTAHILRHALSVSFMMGVLASFGYLFVALMVTAALFPPPG